MAAANACLVMLALCVLFPPAFILCLIEVCKMNVLRRLFVGNLKLVNLSLPLLRIPNGYVFLGYYGLNGSMEDVFLTDRGSLFRLSRRTLSDL